MVKKLLHNKKGDAAVLIMGVILVFAVGAIYLVFTEPYEQIYNSMNDSIGNITNYQDTFTKLRTNWEWWPIIMTFSVMLIVFLRSLRRQPYQYYG